ncbi:MAG: hypothetical protein L6R38_004896, partial [Xanthoria sp. 2 TBL-2021]
GKHIVAAMLLNLIISTYASKPSDVIAGYATIVPETAAPLLGLEARVIIKQWVPENESRIPVAPVKDKEVAYAAQIARHLYNHAKWSKKTEWA